MMGRVRAGAAPSPTGCGRVSPGGASGGAPSAWWRRSSRIPARSTVRVPAPVALAGLAVGAPELRRAFLESGLLVVAPLVVDGASEDADILPVCAGWRDQVAALIAAVPEDRPIRVLAEGRARERAALLVAARGAEGADGLSEAALLLSRDPEAVEDAAAAPVVLALAEQVIGAPLDRLRETGARIVLSDRCDGPLGDGRPASAAAELGRRAADPLAAALLGAGRDLGRARLKEAARRVDGPRPPRLVAVTGGGDRNETDPAQSRGRGSRRDRRPAPAQDALLDRPLITRGNLADLARLNLAPGIQPVSPEVFLPRVTDLPIRGQVSAATSSPSGGSRTTFSRPARGWDRCQSSP